VNKVIKVIRGLFSLYLSLYLQKRARHESTQWSYAKTPKGAFKCFLNGSAMSLGVSATGHSLFQVSMDHELVPFD